MSIPRGLSKHTRERMREKVTNKLKDVPRNAQRRLHVATIKEVPLALESLGCLLRVGVEEEVSPQSSNVAREHTAEKPQENHHLRVKAVSPNTAHR